MLATEGSLFSLLDALHEARTCDDPEDRYYWKQEAVTYAKRLATELENGVTVPDPREISQEFLEDSNVAR